MLHATQLKKEQEMTGKEKVKFLYNYAALDAVITQALKENFLSGDDREQLHLLKTYEKSFTGLNYARLTKEILSKYLNEKEP